MKMYKDIDILILLQILYKACKIHIDLVTNTNTNTDTNTNTNTNTIFITQL